MLEIDTKKIETELQDLIDSRGDKEGESQIVRRHKDRYRVTVKLNKSQDIAMSSRETDEGITISLNPRRYRTQEQLDQHLHGIRKDIVWGS